MYTQRRKLNDISSNMNYVERSDNTRVAPIIPVQVQKVLQENYNKTSAPLKERIERVRDREYYDRLFKAREESKKSQLEKYERDKAKRDAEREEEDRKHKKLSEQVDLLRKRDAKEFWNQVQKRPESLDEADKDFVKFYEKYKNVMFPTNLLFGHESETLKQGITNVWFGLKDMLGSVALSSIKTNGENINSRIGFNDMHLLMADAHKQMLYYLKELGNIQKQKDLFVKQSGYDPIKFATDPNNKEMLQLKLTYDDFTALQKSIEWLMNQNPNLKSLDLAYKQVYTSRKSPFVDQLKQLYHGLVDLTTYPQYEQYVADKRLSQFLNQYDKLIDDKYSEQTGEQQLQIQSPDRKERVAQFDLQETDNFIKNLLTEKKDLQRQYIENREHLAKSTDYWKVRQSYTLGEQVHQNDKLWDLDYWSFSVPTMIGSSASSSSQGLSMAIQTAAAAAGIAESALGAPELAVPTMFAALAITTPLDWIAMYDENYAETGMKRILNIKSMLTNPAFVPESTKTLDSKDSHYKQIMRDLKTKSKQFWLDKGLDEDYIDEYLLGPEGDENVLRDLVGGLITTTDPRVLKAMQESTRGLEALLQTNNIRTGAEGVVQKLFLTPGLGKLKRSTQTILNNMERQTVGDVRSLFDDLAGRTVVFDNAGRATVQTESKLAQQTAADGVRRYKNGFRATDKSLSESVSIGAKHGAVLGDMLGLGIVGEGVGAVAGGTLRGTAHMAKEMMPARVRNVFYTMLEGFARKYADIYDKIMPTKEWKKFAIKYGIKQAEASTVSSMSERAEEAVQYLNEKEDFSNKYGWNKVNFMDLLAHDLSQGGRVLNSYLALFGLSNSELMDDAEYWANGNGGAALGFLHNAAIGSISSAREANAEAKLANMFTRAHIMDREIDKFARIQNVEMARQAMHGNGADMINYIRNKMHEDSRRANPRFDQEDYDDLLDAAQSITSLANNKRVRENLKKKGILPNSENYAIAIADIYQHNKQIADNKELFDKNYNGLLRIYNGVKYPTVWRDAEQTLATDEGVDNLNLNEEEKDIWVLNYIQLAKFLNVMYNRLSALVNLRAKHNTIEDFFDAIHSKFGLSTKRPDARIIHKSIDTQINNVIQEIKKVDTDFSATTDKEILDYLSSVLQPMEGVDVEEIERLEQTNAMLSADMDVLNAHSATMGKENYRQRIETIKDVMSKNAALDWMVNDVYEGDAVTDFIERISRERAKAAVEEALKPQEQLEQLEDPIKGSAKPEEHEDLKYNLAKNKLEFQRRKQEAKEKYRRRRDKYRRWSKGSTKVGVPFMDTIATITLQLVRGAEVGAYKFKLFVDDLKDIYDDVDLLEVMPAIKQAYIKAVAKYSIKNPQVINNLSSVEEVVAYQVESTDTTLLPETPRSPLHIRMLKSFDDLGNNIVQSASSHFDIIVKEGDDVKVYKNQQAIINSNYGVENHYNIRQLVNELLSVIDSELNFKNKLTELTRSNPSIDIDFYTKYRNVDGMIEAIARKYYEQVHDLFIINGKKTRSAVLNILLGNPVNKAQYPRNYDDFEKDILELKNQIEGLGLTILNTEKYIYGLLPNGDRVASQVDIIAADENNKIWVIDVRSGYKPILERLDKPGRYEHSSIRDEVNRGLSQIERLINSIFNLPVQAMYLLPVIYDDVRYGIKVDKTGNQMLVPFKQTQLELYSDDIQLLKNTASELVRSINEKIDQYNLHVEEANKYTNKFNAVDKILLLQYNTSEEYLQYTLELNVKLLQIEDLLLEMSTFLELTQNLESESLEEIYQRNPQQEVPENINAVLNSLIDSVRELDICAQYIPDVKITSKVEADNVKAIYVALFEALRRLNDFLCTEGSDLINVFNEEECIASVMEKMAEHPEIFGKEGVFVRKWWLNNFVLSPRLNTSFLVRNQFELLKGYVNTINSWVSTLENHVVRDLDNHRQLQIWYSTLLNVYFSKLLLNAEQLISSLDDTAVKILEPVIASGHNLIERFNNTWGAPTDEQFDNPPADEIERVSRMPVKWMDKYGQTSFHYPATDAMYISGGYYFMSIQPDFLTNIKFNFYIVLKDKDIYSRDGKSSYTLKKGDVAVYISYNNGLYFADLPFVIDISNYPNPSEEDLLRFAQINRGNVRFTEKVKEMLMVASKNNLKVTADVSVNKGEIKYSPVGTIHPVQDFLFRGSLNGHTIHSIQISDNNDIGVLCIKENRALGKKTYEIRTGSNLERFLAPFNDQYQKDDIQVRSGLIVYLYKTGQNEKIAVPMPTKTIGSDNAIKIADLIYRYITGQQTIDGYNTLALIKQRVYVKDPSKHLSIYNSKTNMIEFVQNGINIGDKFYNIYEDKQAIVDMIAGMPNVANAGQLNKKLISAADGVLDVAYSRLRNGQNSVELPNGFILNISNFLNDGTWFGYLIESGIIGTRANGIGLKQINFGNPYFVNQNNEKLYQLTQTAPLSKEQKALEQQADPFAQLGLLMTAEESELINRSDTQEEDFRKNVRDYFKKVLGANGGEIKFSPKEEVYIKNAAKTAKVVGLTSRAYTEFSLYSPYHVMLHEAFHRIMELVLPEEERKYFYSKYRQHKGLNLTEREVAEGLTDLFIDYILLKGELNKDLPFWLKFKKFCNFCKFMFGYNQYVGYMGMYKTFMLYRNINKGEYAKDKYKITKEAEERFEREFGEGLYYTVKNSNTDLEANFETIADSGELQHMVLALAFLIMETKRLSDPNPDVDSIVIDETTPTILESIGEDGKPIIDTLTGKDLPDSELTNSHLAFREVLQSYEKEVKDKKGNKIGTTRAYPKFAAISDRVSLYISSIYGDVYISVDDSDISEEDDSGENINLQSMGNDAWDKAAYEIRKLDSASKAVKLFLGTIPYVTRNSEGVIYDTSKNIYGVPTYMPLTEVYNTVVNDLGHVKGILELNAELLRLAKISPMYERILNKFRLACSGMWTRNENGDLVIDYNKEAFAIQIVSAISSQKMDFIIASSKKDRDGSKNINIVLSFLGRDVFKLPGQWTKNLISGQVGTFSRNRDKDGNITFADGKLHGHRTDIFSQTSDFIVEMQQALMLSGERKIGENTYNVDSLDDIARLKHDFVKKLHNIGIIISENVIDYILLNDERLGKSKADRDLGKRGFVNWLTLSGTSSLNTFIDLLNNFVYDNGTINQNAVKTGYTKNGFISDLAKWQSKYNKSTVDLRALALNGKELNMISLNNSLSKRIESYNTLDKNNSDVRKLLQYGYNVIDGEKPIGSIIAKKLLRNDNDLHLVAHVYIGFKTDNKGDMGQEYVNQATIDDYIAKFTMLQNNYMISPALADKGTYVVISGLEIPGMLFMTASNSIENYENFFAFPQVGENGKLYKALDDGRLYTWNGQSYVETNQSNTEETIVVGAPTIKFFNGQPYIVPQRSVLSLIREYMITERLAIQRCMADLGYKNIPGYQNEGRTPIPDGAKVENYHLPSKQGVEPNGTRFFGLTLITVKEDGKLNTYNLNDPNESSVDLLRIANEHFFNLSEEDLLDAIALTLHVLTLAAVNRAEQLGVVEHVDVEGEWKDGNGKQHSNKYSSSDKSLFNLDSKHLNQKQIDALTLYFMDQLPHNEFGVWSRIPSSFTGPYLKYLDMAADIIAEKKFRNSIARSLAIAAIINDVTMRSIISTEEYLRCFIGNPAFFGVKYDMDGHKILDSAYDMQKRIGGLISTGEDNIQGLPFMKNTYVVGEIEDYVVSSTADIAGDLLRMFAESTIRELYAIKTGNWNEAFSDISVEELIEKTSGSIRQSLQKAEERSKEYAESVLTGIDVADGAAYITDTMCENLLRIRGALNEDVRQAFNILRTQSNTKDNWMKKRDAYNLIYGKVNIVVYKYTAYGFRDHMLNGEVVSDLTVPYYDKYALFPLFNGIATGPMQDIYKKMMDEGVDISPMHSGVKVGSLAPVKYENGSIDASFNKYEQDYSDIRRLLNTEPEDGDEIPVGTQMAKIVMLNLRTQRQNYKDFRTGKNISGLDLLTKMMNSINALAINGGQNIANQFFVEGTILTDEEKLGKYLAELLNSRNANRATIEAIRLVKNLDDDGKHMQAPLAATADSSWIESILISKINKTVLDIDLPGSSYIQRSAFAMEGKRKEGEGLILSENEINFTINGGRKLQFLNPDGSMDAVITMDYFDKILFKGKLSNMSFEEKRLWLIDHNIIGENATATTVGYRIPTQAESSIHALRFVDVVPAGKTTIILPEEFVTITGADYDIDHLYLVSHNYNVYISEDGQEVVTTSYNPLDEENDSYVKYHLNTFVDCMLTLLTDLPSVGILYRPVDGDTEPIKRIASLIPEDNSTKHLPYNFDTLHEQVIRKTDYINGKFGIAPMALNVTSEQITKAYNIPFAQNRFTRAVGLTGLYDIVDKDDIYIDSWLSGFINAHVDIVKDAYISKLNVNQFTYNMLNLLIRTGFGDTAVWFLAQPIIRDMSNASNMAKSRYAADQEYAKSQYAAEQYLIQQAVSKYIPEEYLTQDIIDKFTISNDRKDIQLRVNTVNSVLRNPKVLEAIARDYTAKTVTVDGVQINVADIQRAVFYTWKALEKYARALSNFIHFSKIDTRKHGKTLIEIARYRDGYLKLYFPEEPEKSVFDVAALLRMAYHSWIHTKTILAINLPMQILANLVFDANPQFRRAIFNHANWLSTTGGALNVELLKKLSRHMRTAVKAEYFVSKYVPELCRPGQTVSEYIRGLFIGPNSMNSRLTRLKYHIENNPKYMRLANNHLINQIYPEIEEDDVFAYGRMVQKPQFVTILNNVDNSKLNGDLLTEGWEDLLRDEDPFVRGFAHDLIIYAFFTSGEFKGWNKMFKYVPANWILGLYNNGLQSFAEYIRNALRNPEEEYAKHLDYIMANLATDPQVVSKMPITNQDGSENFIDGNETIKVGHKVNTIQEARKYIMVRDGVGYNVSNYALYKLVDFYTERELINGGHGPLQVYPIYARMKIRGYNYTQGYNIYEYGFDLNYGENGKDAAAKFDDIAALHRMIGVTDRHVYMTDADLFREVYYDRYEEIEDNGDDTLEPVNIWAGSGENKELSNMESRTFTYDGVTYHSVELAFLLAKLKYALPLTQQPLEVQQAATNPNLSSWDAKRIGRKIKGLNTQEWDANSTLIMHDLVKASFEQPGNERYLSMLLNTGDRPLTHKNENGVDQDVINRSLGSRFAKVITDVRQEFKALILAKEQGEQNRKHCEGE